ncbi:hypothetical protein ABIB80_005587 [Bradyrhizobium sp. i1.15.2]|uniref:hypothetical protein n=1 Tax=Bradyrhizobium sp. i1.15.2 TaxID=3156362 RepID=UPI003392E9C6
MQPSFDFVHLDPFSDPPEPYESAFELFAELWAKLRGFEARCAQDHALVALIRDLEHQLIVAGLILAIQLDLLKDR